jgi:hypothetical protein
MGVRLGVGRAVTSKACLKASSLATTRASVSWRFALSGYSVTQS